MISIIFSWLSNNQPDSGKVSGHSYKFEGSIPQFSVMWRVFAN